MRVGVHGDADVAVSHEILQRLGIHACPRHVGAVGVAADMRRDRRQLLAVDFIVSLPRVLEPMLPMHRHLRHALLVIKQEPRAAADDWFYRRCLPVLQNSGKTAADIICHENLARTGIGFCFLYDVLHGARALQLVVDVDDAVFHIEVPDGQSAELGNTHPGMEEDVEHLVVFPVAAAVMDEFQEGPHLFRRQSLTHDGIIDHDVDKREGEGVAPEHFIIHSHLEGRAQHTAHTVNGAVPLAVFLQLDEEQLGIRALDVPDFPFGKRFFFQEVADEAVVHFRIRAHARLHPQVTVHQIAILYG